jgi:ribosomal protein L12E/L44/L45/RPP1/RPP2
VEVEERFSKNSESSPAMAAGPALPLPAILGNPTAEDELEAEAEEEEEEMKGNPSSSLF